MLPYSKLLYPSLLLGTYIFSGTAYANSLTNGNFDTDLSGWNDINTNGSTQWQAGVARLTTGVDIAPYSAILVQGDDGSFSFNNPIVISATDEFFKFDAVFAAQTPDATETGTSFLDNLQVWLYDVDGSSTQMASINALTGGGLGYSVDLKPYAGHSVAFSFELNDEDDGFNSSVALDNIHITPSAVPLPAALWLQITGLLGLIGHRWRKRR